MGEVLESILVLVKSTDVKDKHKGVTELIDFFQQEPKKLTNAEIKELVDLIIELLKNNVNFKIVEGVLFLIPLLLTINTHLMKPHLAILFPLVVERLGDLKQVVREKALETLVSFNIAIPFKELISMLDKQGYFKHKNWRIKESVCHFFIRIIVDFGLASGNASAKESNSFKTTVLEAATQYLGDTTPNVRTAAISLLETLYQKMGDKLIGFLTNKNIRAGQIQELTERFKNIIVEDQNNTNFQSQVSQNSQNSQNSSTPNSPRSNENNENNAENAGLIDDQFVTQTPASANPKFNSKMTRDLSQKTIPTLFNSELLSNFNPENSRQINATYNRLSTALQLPDTEWEARQNALKELTLIVDYLSTEQQSQTEINTNFVIFFNKFRNEMAKHIVEKRSSLVKDACTLIEKAVTVMRDAFDLCAESFIPSLLKQTQVTILVIADSADSALKSIFLNCKITKPMFLQLVEETKSKHQIVRNKSFEYIRTVLSMTSTKHLTKIDPNGAILANVLKSGISDAHSEVRKTARTCFAYYASHCPKIANDVFNALDPSISKTLKLELENLNQTFPIEAPVSATTPPKKVWQTKEKQANSPNSVEKHSKTIGIGEIESQKQKAQQNTIHSPFRRTNSDKRILEKSNSNSNLNNPQKTNVFKQQQPQKLAKTENLEDIEDENEILFSEDPESTSFLISPLTSPKFAQNHLPNNFQKNRRKVLSSPIAAANPINSDVNDFKIRPVNVNLVENEEDLVSNSKFKSNNDDLKQEDLENEDLTKNEKISEPNQEELQQDQLQQQEDELQQQQQESQQEQDQLQQQQDELQKQQDGIEEEELAEEIEQLEQLILSFDLNSLIDSTASKDWQKRIESFTNIAAFSRTYNKAKQLEFTKSISRIVYAHTSGFHDNHFKVRVESLKSMSWIIANYPKALEKHLEQLFSSIFSVLNDKKPEPAAEATNLLQSVIPNYYSADKLLSALLKVLDSSNKFVLLASEEYLLHMIQENNSVLFLQKNKIMMKCFILRLLTIITTIGQVQPTQPQDFQNSSNMLNENVKRAAESVVFVFSTSQGLKAGFEEQLIAMKSEQLQVVKGILERRLLGSSSKKISNNKNSNSKPMTVNTGE